MMRLVLRQSVVLIVIGVAVGLCGAWAAGRALERFVEGMRPPEPFTLALMTSVLVAAALLASAVPARRAGRVEAIQTLRHHEPAIPGGPTPQPTPGRTGRVHDGSHCASTSGSAGRSARPTGSVSLGGTSSTT